MENKFNDQVDILMEDKNSSKFDTTKTHIPGKIASTIGQGDDARNSIIYLTLKWAFVTGIVVTLLVVFNHWFFRINEKIPDFMEDIKIAWDIIVPLITLALGYAFGKSEK